jgi:hypothetical protein
MILSEMANTLPHHDIATQRHTPKPQSSPQPQAPQTTADLQSQAGLPAASPERPDAAGSNPMAREVQLTPAPALLLHLPATELRTILFRPSEPGPQRRRASERDDDAPNTAEPEVEPDAEENTPTPDPDTPAKTPLPSTTGDADLYQQLLSALHTAGTTPLLDELKAQRRALLVTPIHGAVPGLRCNAYIDLLWPVHGGGRALRLRGEILWAQIPKADPNWQHTHLIKTLAPGGVRQLAPTQARHIAVCLGAQATPMTAWSLACVRIHDSTLLWRALEPQWSLRLALCSAALPVPTAGGTHAA